jgi:hypothetical protein
LPRLLDQKAFALVADKITRYALDKAISEWSLTKRLEDHMLDEENSFDGIFELPFTPGSECKEGCELPLRYGLPCKHWLYKALIKDIPISLSFSPSLATRRASYSL